MCGIAGGVGAAPPTQAQLDHQLRTLKHRGPDSKGTVIGKNFAIGMTRLAILEIQDGVQPAKDEFEKIHLVFNGEIYNYKELQTNYFPSRNGLQNGSEAALLIALYKFE